MGRRSEHTRSELQHLILEATTDLIENVGAEGVTARMIADRIGYTPGMLYTAFDSLPDILITVNNHSLEILTDRCVTAAADSTAPLDSLLAVAQAYSRFAEQHNHRFNMLFDHTVIRKPTSTLATTENISGILDTIEKALARLTPQVSTETLRTGSLSLWSAIHGACFLGVSNNWNHSNEDSPQIDAAPSDRIDAVLHNLVTVFCAGWVQQY